MYNNNLYYVRNIKRGREGVERGRMPPQRGRMAHQRARPTWLTLQQKKTHEQ